MSVEAIADTRSGVLTDFRPYVPAIDAAGGVAFQARFRGGEGIFAWTEAEGLVLVKEGPVVSHPARTPNKQFSAFVGAPPVLWASWTEVPCEGTLKPGPLGPTMNSRGDIAFRGDDATGRNGIYLWQEGAITLIAHSGETWNAFHGLPVVNDVGDVIYRAEAGDRHAVCLWTRGQTSIVAESGDLGYFPSIDALGEVGFSCATGAVLVRDGIATALAVPRDGFESFRHCLPRGGRPPAIVATPTGGQMGLYVAGKRCLGIGDSHDGGVVAEFALNPVSVSAAPWIAVRLLMQDKTQRIVRVTCEA